MHTEGRELPFMVHLFIGYTECGQHSGHASTQRKTNSLQRKQSCFHDHIIFSAPADPDSNIFTTHRDSGF